MVTFSLVSPDTLADLNAQGSLQTFPRPHLIFFALYASRLLSFYDYISIYFPAYN